MRIDKVHIEDYKNLKEFNIDLDEKEMKTVLLGQNATGKSNFMEALILIFKYLDLEKEVPLTIKLKYSIEYRCRTFSIKVSNLTGKYEFEVVDNKTIEDNIRQSAPKYNKITRSDFFRNKESYLPKYVFAYYSGISNKLNELFWDHQDKFYREIIKEGFKDEKLDTLRRLFYVKIVHSYFVLLAYFTHKDEDSTKFLNDVLGIEDIESILFVFKMPDWAKNRIKKKPDDVFWTADGLVRSFLDRLWDLSIAPIYNSEGIRTDFDDYTSQERLYLFLKGKESLDELSKIYTTNTALFKALESTYLSKMIAEVRIRVKKKSVDNSITFKELSEGEQQLLTVLGLLKFTKDEESLILLDEPDTHLNPIWKWRYLEFLNKVFGEDTTSQIIINTHDPLVIGSLKKEEVRIFRLNEDKKLEIEAPHIDPRAMDIVGILRSELFGLPSVLSKYMQLKLNRKRYLQFKIERNENSPQENDEFKQIENEISESGFNDSTFDPWYDKYLEAISENPMFQKVEFSEEEEVELKKLSKAIIEKLTKQHFSNEAN